MRKLLTYETAVGSSLLQADHVGPALRNIAADEVAPGGVGLMTTKIHDIVRQHLHAAARGRRRQVKRHIGTHGQNAARQAHKRYPRPARCQQQTDEEHGHIGRQKKRERKTDDTEETTPCRI